MTTNYGFIIYTQVRMTKLLVMLSDYMYMLELIRSIAMATVDHFQRNAHGGVTGRR